MSRPEYQASASDDPRIASYREALMTAGIGVQTTLEELERACAKVTDEHNCINNSIVEHEPARCHSPLAAHRKGAWSPVETREVASGRAGSVRGSRRGPDRGRRRGLI